MSLSMMCRGSYCPICGSERDVYTISKIVMAVVTDGLYPRIEKGSIALCLSCGAFTVHVRDLVCYTVSNDLAHEVEKCTSVESLLKLLCKLIESEVPSEYPSALPIYSVVFKRFVCYESCPLYLACIRPLLDFRVEKLDVSRGRLYVVVSCREQGYALRMLLTAEVSACAQIRDSRERTVTMRNPLSEVVYGEATFHRSTL